MSKHPTPPTPRPTVRNVTPAPSAFAESRRPGARPRDRAFNDPHLKRGCIGPTSLRHLATVIEGLARWHDEMDGSIVDLPCLRRIEMDGHDIVAHVSSGPAVGGTWFRLVLGRHGWTIDDAAPRTEPEASS